MNKFILISLSSVVFLPHLASAGWWQWGPFRVGDCAAPRVVAQQPAASPPSQLPRCLREVGLDFAAFEVAVGRKSTFTQSALETEYLQNSVHSWFPAGDSRSQLVDLLEADQESLLDVFSSIADVQAVAQRVRATTNRDRDNLVRLQSNNPTSMTACEAQRSETQRLTRETQAEISAQEFSSAEELLSRTQQLFSFARTAVARNAAQIWVRNNTEIIERRFPGALSSHRASLETTLVGVLACTGRLDAQQPVPVPNSILTTASFLVPTADGSGTLRKTYTQSAPQDRLLACAEDILLQLSQGGYLECNAVALPSFAAGQDE